MRGSCLCKSIEYEISKLDSEIEHCSCQTCRKAHAAAFNTAASVKHDHFRWIKGEELLTSYESSPGKKRFFCTRCGTHLVAQRYGKDYFVLRVATLDSDEDKQADLDGPHELGFYAHFRVADALQQSNHGRGAYRLGALVGN